MGEVKRGIFMSIPSFPVWNISISENDEDGSYVVNNLSTGLRVGFSPGQYGIMFAEDEFELFVLISPGQNMQYRIGLFEAYLDGGIEVLAQYSLPHSNGLEILSSQLNEYYNSSHNLSRKIWETSEDVSVDADIYRDGIKKLRQIFANPASAKKAKKTAPTEIDRVNAARDHNGLPPFTEEEYAKASDGWTGQCLYCDENYSHGKRHHCHVPRGI